MGDVCNKHWSLGHRVEVLNRSYPTVRQQGEVGQALLGSHPLSSSCSSAVARLTTTRVANTPSSTPTSAETQGDQGVDSRLGDKSAQEL